MSKVNGSGGLGNGTTSDAPIMESVERIASTAFQGFLIGSIFGLSTMNRPRRPEEMIHPTGTPIQYEELATSIARKGAHCAIFMSLFSGTVEILDVVRGRKDPPAHYGAGGLLGGFAAGGLVSLMRSEALRFSWRTSIPAAAFFGAAGLITGLGERYIDSATERSRARTAAELKGACDVGGGAELGSGNGVSPNSTALSSGAVAPVVPIPVETEGRSLGDKLEDYIADLSRRSKN